MVHEVVNGIAEKFLAGEAKGVERHPIDECAFPLWIQSPDSFTSGVQQRLPMRRLLLALRRCCCNCHAGYKVPQTVT